MVGVDQGEEEVPKAFVVLHDDVEQDSFEVAEVHSFVGERLSEYKRLRGGVEVRGTLPKSPTGKLLRRELRGGGN